MTKHPVKIISARVSSHIAFAKLLSACKLIVLWFNERLSREFVRPFEITEFRRQITRVHKSLVCFRTTCLLVRQIRIRFSVN